MSIRVLSETEIRNLVPMAVAIEAVKKALISLEKGEFEWPQRLSFGQSAALVMPLFHRPTRSVVTKSLSLDPCRLPVISGAVTWAAAGDLRTIVADAATVTAIRTGAIVGLAVDLLAPANANRLVLFGAGAQACDQVRAITCVRDLKTVSVVSRTMQRATATATLLSNEFPEIQFSATIDGRPDLLRCDLVSCATPATTPLFSVEDLPDRVTVTAIGSFTPLMRELPQDLLATTRPVYVDDIAACLVEAGEIVCAVAGGRMRSQDLNSLGNAALRSKARTDRQVFKSVGIAPQDWAVMRAIHDKLAVN